MSDPPGGNVAGLDQAKLAAARLWAVTRLPYLARALFACTPRSAPGSGTIAVDRAWRLHADPGVLDSLSTSEVGRLWVHLAGHLIRDHAARAETRRVSEDNARAWWNRSGDAELNDDLAADDCVPNVAADLPPDLGGQPGGLAETYYVLEPTGARRWDCGSGADGAPRPWDGPDPGSGQPGLSLGQRELLRLGVAADIQAQHATEPGTVAGGWRRWAEAVLPSRTDWRRVLAAEIRTAIAAVAGSVDYTYRRPSRRAASTANVIMPALYRPVPEVAVICDTSASMHEQLLAAALAEIETLLTKAGLRPAQTRVLAVDTAVHTVNRVTRASQVRLAGGGGTDMGEGIHAATQLRPRPSIIIVLTDGYTPWPPQPPRGVRVVVGLLGQNAPGWQAPGWARTVHIDEIATPDR